MRLELYWEDDLPDVSSQKCKSIKAVIVFFLTFSLFHFFTFLIFVVVWKPQSERTSAWSTLWWHTSQVI